MLKLYTDHYFHIGSMHLTSGKPCQDYSISGVYNDIALAIVSDGCSSGRHTDVGARVLALSTAIAIREHWTVNRSAFSEAVSQEVNFRQKIILAGTRQALGLEPRDMLATSVYSYVSPLGGFIHIAGDGVVALKYRDGRIVMHRFEWKNNTPYYPAYSESGLSDFIKVHGDDLNALRLSQESCERKVESDFTKFNMNYHTLGAGIRGINIDISAEILSGELKFVALFSDGVTQVDSLDWKEAVLLFMAFKNTTGEFAKRRMIRGIKDVQKKGKGSLDDISYAVIRVEKTETEEV